jgi:putative FmdB family regulatory protein
MPIYEYKCAACGEEFEEFRFPTESDKDVICPKCGSEKAKRTISTFSSSSPGESSGSCSSGGGHKRFT